MKTILKVVVAIGSVMVIGLWGFSLFMAKAYGAFGADARNHSQFEYFQAYIFGAFALTMLISTMITRRGFIVALLILNVGALIQAFGILQKAVIPGLMFFALYGCWYCYAIMTIAESARRD